MKVVIVVVGLWFVIAAIITLVSLSGCASSGSYYPGQVPAGCRVSDGYCAVKVDGRTDTYVWTPQHGWRLYSREK